MTPKNRGDMAAVAAKLADKYAETGDNPKAASRLHATIAHAAKNLTIFFHENSNGSRGDVSKFRTGFAEVAGAGITDAALARAFGISAKKTAARARRKRTARAESGSASGTKVPFTLMGQVQTKRKVDLSYASAFWSRLGTLTPGKEKHTRIRRAGVGGEPEARLDKSREWKKLPDSKVWDCGTIVKLFEKQEEYMQMCRRTVRETPAEMYAAWLLSPECAAHVSGGGGLLCVSACLSCRVREYAPASIRPAAAVELCLCLLVV